MLHEDDWAKSKAYQATDEHLKVSVDPEPQPRVRAVRSIDL